MLAVKVSGMHSMFKRFPADTRPVNTPRRTALMILAASTLIGPWNARAGVEPMAYRYWDWGKTPKRDDYQVAALTLALQKTVAGFGPFSVERVVDIMSTSRSRREVHAGRRLNVHAGPWRDLEAEDPSERSIMMSTPIMGGLLGYRRLIVRRRDLLKFEKISTAAELKKLVAGQGRSWVDVPLLRQNGYPVVDSGNIATLLDMLVNQRFDYLPISVVEADFMMAEHAPLADTLALVPGLMLYYPFPVMFYVSPNQPRLAERMEAGLAAAKRDGSLDALTTQFFRAEIQQVKASAGRCFILDNPIIPKNYVSEPLRLIGR